jgi:hypothetical protein
MTKDLNYYLPVGLFATKKWLMGQKVSEHTIDNWLKSGRILNCASGVYKRPELPLEWQGVLSSFARMKKEPVYLGGLSALEDQGFGHYLKSKKEFTFYSSISKPSWADSLLSEVSLKWKTTRKLWPADYHLLSLKKVNWREGFPTFLQANTEQAYLEMLSSVPEEFSFEYGDQMIQGLVQLSPVKLKQLLKNCKSVKVKRLFFWFAKRHNHDWLKHLNQKDIDFGSGKRVLIKNGSLDKEFLITIPREMNGQ